MFLFSRKAEQGTALLGVPLPHPGSFLILPLGQLSREAHFSCPFFSASPVTIWHRVRCFQKDFISLKEALLHSPLDGDPACKDRVLFVEFLETSKLLMCGGKRYRGGFAFLAWGQAAGYGGGTRTQRAWGNLPG